MLPVALPVNPIHSHAARFSGKIKTMLKAVEKDGDLDG
jgi:hypothetical protein